MHSALSNVNPPGTRFIEPQARLMVKKQMSLPVRYAVEALNGTWRINVGGRIYGPYTGHQIKAFATEGRVAPHSIVQAGEMGPWITAIDDPVLGQLFVIEGSRWDVQPAAKSEAGASDFAPASGTSATLQQESNFLVVTDMKGTGTGPVQSVISKLGESYRLTPSVWIVRSAVPAGTIRNEITLALGRHDSVFVVDATQNRTAWFNFGPDADAHIRKIWTREPDKTH